MIAFIIVMMSGALYMAYVFARKIYAKGALWDTQYHEFTHKYVMQCDSLINLKFMAMIEDTRLVFEGVKTPYEIYLLIKDIEDDWKLARRSVGLDPKIISGNFEPLDKSTTPTWQERLKRQRVARNRWNVARAKSH